MCQAAHLLGWLIGSLVNWHIGEMSRFLTRTNLLLAAIMLVAAFFRLYRLDQVPPGFQFDQAFYVFDALKLLQGQFFIFFYQPGRSEPLYQYLLMVGVALFGADTPLGLKLTGVVIGLLTIPVIYGFTRTLFKSPFIALLAALFTAISFWQVFYSRYGERNPLTALMAILVFWFLWRALTPTRWHDDKVLPTAVQSGRATPASAITAGADVASPVGGRGGHRWRYFAFTGFFTGVTLYTYPGGRVLPMAIVLIVAYAMLTDRFGIHWQLSYESEQAVT